MVQMAVLLLEVVFSGPWHEITEHHSPSSKCFLTTTQLFRMTNIYSLSHLHPKLNVPVRAIVVQAIFNLLFGLLYLGKFHCKYLETRSNRHKARRLLSTLILPAALFSLTSHMLHQFSFCLSEADNLFLPSPLCFLSDTHLDML